MITLNSLQITITIAVAMLAFGLWYAWHIYKNPPREGYTYVSVIVGVGVTLIGITLSLLAVLVEYQLFWRLWWILILPLGFFILTGGPMIVWQESKRREDEFNARLAITEIEKMNSDKWVGLFKTGLRK